MNASAARWRAERLLANASTFWWAHPEWWCLVLSTAAWMTMLEHSVAHWGHAHHHWLTLPRELWHFGLMILAMMVPPLVPQLRIAAFRSLARRRHRAMLGFLVGYLTPWLVFALPVALVHQLAWTHTHAAVAGTFALAAAWTRTPFRRRASLSCHRTVPLPPLGCRADRSCFHYGWLIGLSCLGTCWLLMLGCTISGHAVTAMVGGGAIAVLDKKTDPSRVTWITLATVALAACYGIMALSS